MSVWRRLTTLMRLDLMLAWRHKLVHVTLIVALVFGALLAFAVPEQVELGGTDYIVDASAGQRFAALREAHDPELVLDSEAAARAAVEDDGGSIGIVFRGDPEAPAATVFVQGSESPERLALIRTGTDAVWQSVGMSDGAPLEVPKPTVLDPDAQKPPFNASLVPILYALDLCVLGFMFGSVMVLQDKQQQTIRMYSVGPGGALEYLLSKLGVNLGLSLLNLVVVTGFAAPWGLADPRLYLLAVSICGGMTLLGVALSVFLRSITQWFFPMAAITMLMAIPTYSFFVPTRALDWTFWIPTHHIVFGADALLFAGGGAPFVTALLYGLSFFALMALLSGAAVHGRLLREVH